MSYSYSSEVPWQGTSNGYPQHVFIQKKKKRKESTEKLRNVSSRTVYIEIRAFFSENK